ncbi:MAG TPA: glycosyltransferase, partial [Candidatus Didemnitutus sp.]|nr:glycosyltransferase [Candidatus Didemnitutus sp.]
RELRVPVVTHLHTVLEKPDPLRRRVMDEILERSARLIVMTQHGRHLLQEVYGVSPDRVNVIPHGIPDMAFVDPGFFKDQFGVEGRKVLLTFGLLTPVKGIEYVIEALPEIARAIPEVIYVILGVTHPSLVRAEGEAYRLRLERLVSRLGMREHVVFYNRFVGLQELKEFIGAADVYLTPYTEKEQITSGTLTYAFGCGKAVVSTPYWHAEELLANGRGILVPFADSASIAREVVALLQDDVRYNAIRKQAYLLGREMTWHNVAHEFMACYREARLEPARKKLTLSPAELALPVLPALRLDHLRQLTDDTGVFHHAVHSVPEWAGGYQTRDNARALRLAVLLAETDDTPERAALEGIYASFVGGAFIPETGRFHDHLTFARQWGSGDGSDATLGVVIWALCTCVARATSRSLQRWAVQLLERALPVLESVQAPSAWAYGLLGINEYLQRLTGDRMAAQLNEGLARRLIDGFPSSPEESGRWFEERLGPDNVAFSHALLVAGARISDRAIVDIGLASLRWRLAQSRAPAEDNAMSVPAENGSFERRRRAPRPLETAAMVGACLEAFAITRDNAWWREARQTFEWFLGRNELGEPLGDPVTGGCCDALEIDRVNLNQGAEATLAFLLSLQEMLLVEAGASDRVETGLPA